jgi:adenylate kinase
MKREQLKPDLLIATFGPPGSGKSTLCRSLAETFVAETVSPGHELRRLAARGGPVGEEAKRLISAAAPVPDSMLWWMLTEHGSGPLTLDGVPQNIAQVELIVNFAAEYYYRLAGVHLILSRDIARDRILNRWYCAQCREPADNGEPCCDCGGTLYQRFDDTMASTISARLNRYERDVVPAATKFSALFEYSEFDASNDFDDLFARVKAWITPRYDASA